MKKKTNTISHVLGDFSKSEKLILDKIFDKVINSLEQLDDNNEDSVICELNSFKV